MLGLVVDLALGLLFPRRRRRPFPGMHHTPPTAAVKREVRTLTADYARWAASTKLARDAAARGYRGRIAGADVLVRPGLEGSAPIGTEAEIAIEHDELASYLLTPERKAEGDLATALAPVFEEDALADLRSIGVRPGGLRLRFKALTEPETVHAAIDRAVGVIDDRRRARAPYR